MNYICFKTSKCKNLESALRSRNYVIVKSSSLDEAKNKAQKFFKEDYTLYSFTNFNDKNTFRKATC